jgi:hypothetical protein
LHISKVCQAGPQQSRRATLLCKRKRILGVSPSLVDFRPHDRSGDKSDFRACIQPQVRCVTEQALGQHCVSYRVLNKSALRIHLSNENVKGGRDLGIA